MIGFYLNIKTKVDWVLDVTSVIHDKAQSGLVQPPFLYLLFGCRSRVVYHPAVLNKHINGLMPREILLLLCMDGLVFCLLPIATVALGPQEKNYRSYLFDVFCLFFGEKVSHSVAQVCLELGTILPPPFLKCWNYRHKPSSRVPANILT